MNNYDLEIERIEKIIGYCFHNKRLLIQALMHTTFAHELQDNNIADNQRLEFLGDSILGMIVAEYLYLKNPSFAEGELTRQRSSFVNKHSLAKQARTLDIPNYLLLGKGESKLGGSENSRNLSGALEAVIGAIYLDGGLEEARKFIVSKICIEDQRPKTKD